MNISVGRTSSSGKNWPGFGALLAGVTVAGVLAGVAIWQATGSDSKSQPAEPAAARSVEFPRPTSFSPIPTYVYLVDSQEQATSLYQADAEAQLSPGAEVLTHNIRVIDMSTPEGQEQYRIMNAEQAQAQIENPDYDSGLFQVIDLTAPERTLAPEAPAAVPTYFYIVDSQEQADRVLQAETMSAQEAAMAGVVPDEHHTEIIDVSTLEGQQLLNVVNGDLYEFWSNPDADQSLVQVIDAR
jgi:hypothetical protein